MKYSAVDQNNQIERFDLLKNEKIGEGATALVYKVNYKNQTWAAKIFKDGQKINSAKLQAMLEHQPEDLSINIDGHDYIQYAWVKYVIKNGVGKTIGFMMPYVDHDETYSLDTFYDPVLSKRLTPFELALTLRIQLAINLCELIENLHRNQNYFIDIKPQNIKVYKKNHKVVLLDCDGYSIYSKNSIPNRYEAELISTDYIAPEVTKGNLKPNSLGLQQDLYGLAVILFQLLNRGTHPFQGIATDKSITASTNDERAALGLYAYGLKSNWKVKPRPQSIHNYLLDETRVLFDKSFQTQSRTTAQEWIDHFKGILDSKKLELCNKVDRVNKLERDLIHIKFSGKECIGCKLESEKPTTIKNNKKIYTLNQNNNANQTSNTTSNSSTYQTFSVNNIPNIKPDEFNFQKFFSYAAAIIFILYLIVKCTDGSNNSSTTSASSNQVTSSSPQIELPCDFSVKLMPTGQLCEKYWSKTIKYSYQCNILISKELNDRGLYSIPEDRCGSKTMDPAPSSAPTVLSKPIPLETQIQSENYNEKINKLSTAYGVNKFSREITKGNAENNALYRQIVNEIVRQFKDSSKSAEYKDGLTIYKNLNMPFISKVVWYASEQDICTEKSLGITETCLIRDGVATCQSIDLNVNYKSICVESFTK